jgi:hypothetical protein
MEQRNEKLRTADRGAVRFLREPNGDAEQSLKTALSKRFAESTVERAFLARVRYDDPGAVEMALAVVAQAAERAAVVAAVQQEFRVAVA